MDLALARPSKERKITFREIASRCQVLLTKAQVHYRDRQDLDYQMADGKPKDKVKKVLSLVNRIATWSKDVIAMENIVSENVREILAKS
ncbi:proteasome regulatory particle subunit [Parelaphostrongylus tenuis]|uniref:Proteasome regulatory particle subunit n=1 Tax=Parelaphostrongylus tenuis TaxID=148309 RepID=A0AAD5QRB5_PARTN|nr:proteasome regulatory particle subunit [Parelaphostrongylus tenuis]